MLVLEDRLFTIRVPNDQVTALYLSSKQEVNYASLANATTFAYTSHGSRKLLPGQCCDQLIANYRAEAAV